MWAAISVCAAGEDVVGCDGGVDRVVRLAGFAGDRAPGRRTALPMTWTCACSPLRLAAVRCRSLRGGSSPLLDGLEHAYRLANCIDTERLQFPSTCAVVRHVTILQRLSLASHNRSGKWTPRS